MLVALSDTHRETGTGLEGRAAAAVDAADRAVHAGDFITEPVHDALVDRAGDLAAVAGNNDEAPLRRRLPAERTVEYRGLALAIAHQVRGGETAHDLFGRERQADVVVVGHSHRPALRRMGECWLLNPGSHAEPRGGPRAHAELRVQDASDGDPDEAGAPPAGSGTDAGTVATAEIVTVEGECLERAQFPVGG